MIDEVTNHGAARWVAQGRAGLAAACFVAALVGCGGGTDEHTQAAQSDAAIASSTPGRVPFIAFVQLTGLSLKRVTEVAYTIAARPGTVSKPVHVAYTLDALIRRGYFVAGASTLTVPVFGLYAGRSNLLTLTLRYADGSTSQLTRSVDAEPYADPFGLYDRPVVHTARKAGSALGFDFFAVKAGYLSPVVIDSDGELRWLLPNTPKGPSSAFVDNGFVVGDQDGPTVTRIELDGTISASPLAVSSTSRFHHNVDPGKYGLIGEVGEVVDGLLDESVAVEFDRTGAVLARWDFGSILSAYMLKNGDDPTLFVRPDADWFHLNAVTYDPRDDSIIASSRENFLLKLDYKTGDIVWIFGDPAKYWYTFPSLRAKALTLSGLGLYPIGQHAVSITSDGLLLLFNNGTPSDNQPVSAPAGDGRSYSAVSAYTIDLATRSAHEAWRFDNGRTLDSPYCSSAYQAADKSLLVDYAVLDGGRTARVVGLDPAHEVVFDFEYASPLTCVGAWNSVPLPLDDLRFE